MRTSLSTSPSISFETGIPVQRLDDVGDVLGVDLLLQERVVALELGQLVGRRRDLACRALGSSP